VCEVSARSLVPGLVALMLAASCGGGGGAGGAGGGHGQGGAGAHPSDASTDGAGASADTSVDSRTDAAADAPADSSAADRPITDTGSFPDGPIAPANCFANWRTVYTSVPGELAPVERHDLAWGDGTLYVGHSATGYAWVFSIPDHGGAKNLLYEGHVRDYWLEGDRLVYAQDNDLFAMPRTGGPPTEILHYGDIPGGDLLYARILDATAIYGMYSDFSGVSIWRHLRGGVEDTNLATLTSATTLGQRVWTEQARGKLVLSFKPPTYTSAGQPYAVTISKADGTLTQLPGDGANSTLLAASIGGGLLWSRHDSVVPDGGFLSVDVYSYAVANIDGTAPADLTTPIPSNAIPVDAWAAGDHAWYVATSELDTSQVDASPAAFLSIWYLPASGAAFRVACDPVSGPPTVAHVSPSRISAGLAADGAFYASVIRPDSTWLIAAADNPGAHSDTGDVGGAVDGGVSTGTGGAGGTDGGACPSLPATVGGPPELTEFLIPGPSSNATYIVTGPDGALYFGEIARGALGRITTDGCITQIPIAAGAEPSYIIVGPDHYLWFTDLVAPISRMLQDGSLRRQFSVSPAGTPTEITFGPDGNLWFGAGPSMVRMTPAGTITIDSLPSRASSARYAVSAPDGKIWFVDTSFHTLGNIDPATGTLAPPLQVPNNGTPGAMTLGPDGNLWAIDTRPSLPPALVRITTAGAFTEFPLAAGSAPSVLCAGPDGNVWVGENGTSPNMTRLVPSTGAITAFPVPVISPALTSCTAGPDGNIWFLEESANRIGRIKL